MPRFPALARRWFAAALPGTMLFAAMPALAARPAGDPSCAWGGKVTVDEQNTLFPESHAAYWSTNFVVHPGLSIGLTGAFPDSRFMSLTVYKGEGGAFSVNGVDSTMTDYEIAPDPGTVNPWQPPQLRFHKRPQIQAAGTYSIDMVADPSPGMANVVPLAPAGTADGTVGRLVYRIYLPSGGDFDATPLPRLTLYRDGVTTTLPVCSADASAAAEATTGWATTGSATTGSATTGSATTGSATTGSAVAAGDISFARPSPDLGLLPNTDSGYIAAVLAPPGGDQVLVIRGRGAGSADGEHPSPWPQPGEDLRYWSMCVNLDNAQRSLVANVLPDGTTDYGCRDDDETALDSSGYYTYVVATEAQRAAVERIPGVTFVPWSATRPHATHLIFLRNMLADIHFASAVQNVPGDQDPASARAVMGEYYPRDAICPLATVETAGAGACLDGS